MSINKKDLAKNTVITQRFKVCLNCDYTRNEAGASKCEMCGEKLINKGILQNIEREEKKTKKLFEEADLSRNSKKRLSTPVNKNIKLIKASTSKILGLIIIGLGISLWGNYLVKSYKGENVTTNKSASALSNSPNGLFSYGGAPFYAPLVSHGLNTAVEAKNRGFQLRYAKPLNQDFSYANGISMLIDGELSFAFNGRPLSDEEYQKANLRGISLKQVPIAIDGIVFFGNNNKSVSKLSIEQVEDIFRGQVTNWNQIDPEVPDLTITPILLNNEDLSMLGIEANQIAPTTQYAPSYTQAIRKVISIPGGISFSSASLVKGQELIGIFDLAGEDSNNHISAFRDRKPNLDAFRYGQYPLTRRLYLVYREDGSLDQQAGKTYVNFLNSQNGQKIIENSGFVPLR